MIRRATLWAHLHAHDGQRQRPQVWCPLQCKQYGLAKQNNPAAFKQISRSYYKKKFIDWYQIQAYHLYIKYLQGQPFP